MEGDFRPISDPVCCGVSVDPHGPVDDNVDLGLLCDSLIHYFTPVYPDAIRTEPHNRRPPSLADVFVHDVFQKLQR